MQPAFRQTMSEIVDLTEALGSDRGHDLALVILKSQPDRPGRVEFVQIRIEHWIEERKILFDFLVFHEFLQFEKIVVSSDRQSQNIEFGLKAIEIVLQPSRCRICVILDMLYSSKFLTIIVIISSLECFLMTTPDVFKF
jgi:hypothetical protein